MVRFNSKPFFQRRFRPLVDYLGQRGVRANQVTMAALAISLVAGLSVLSFSQHPAVFLAVPIALVVRFVCNHVDGMLARGYGSESRLGRVFSEQSDVVCDAVLYLPLAAVAGVSMPIVVVAVVAGFIAELTGVLGYAVGATRREDGPVTKKIRGLAFGGIYLALAFGVTAGQWIDVVLATVIAFLAVTVVRRTVAAIGEAVP